MTGGQKHTPTREPPLTRDSIHPLPFFLLFYPDDIPDHAGLFAHAVETSGGRMGGDGIEVWVILSHARSLIYIRHKTGCGSGKAHTDAT